LSALVTAYFAPRDEADAKPAMARGFVDDVQLKPRCLSAEAFFRSSARRTLRQRIVGWTAAERGASNPTHGTRAI
jgi:hypothetical protein